MHKPIRVAQFGLGPIGLETIKLAASQPWAEVLGGIDIDPDKIGCDLGQLTANKSLRGRSVFASLDELLKVEKPDLAFHTTVSKLDTAYPQLESLARRGISVVSSCEELIFPQLRHPKLAARLDHVCRKNDARIVGTGVNPGFVMDVLPLCLTGVCRKVRAVHIQRIVDASTRREPLQRKIGSGWTPEEFKRRFRCQQAGHAGLRESLALVAHGLGWRITEVKEFAQPIVADHDIQTQFLQVKAGQTCGLHQRAEARHIRKVCLTLDLKMYLGASEPHDAIQIEGEPPLDVMICGGVAGDQATVAALVNTATRLLDAPPGLRLMTDLSLPRSAA